MGDYTPMTIAALHQGTRKPERGGRTAAMEDEQSNPRANKNCGMIMVRFQQNFISPMHG